MNYLYYSLIIFGMHTTLCMEKNNFKKINIHNQTTFPIEVRLKEFGIQQLPSKIEPWNNIQDKKEIAAGNKEELRAKLTFTRYLREDSYQNMLIVNYMDSPNRIATFEDPLNIDGGAFVVKETKAKYKSGLSLMYQYGLK